MLDQKPWAYYALRQQQDLLTDLTDWLYAQANQARRNSLQNRSGQLYTDLMSRALDDLQHVSVRLLRFPKDYSLGELSVREERNIDSPTRVLGLAQGMVRVVLFDRREDSPTHGTAWSIDIGDDNPCAVYVPGRTAHGYESLTDCLFCYHVTH